MLRIPNPQPNPRIFPESVRIQICKFFADVSDGCGWSVPESVFTYQVAVFKRRCVTAAAGRRHRIISTVVVGKGGGG